MYSIFTLLSIASFALSGSSWYWVPGTIWGPAWVTWRSNDMYIGWAPLPPDVDLEAGTDFASLSIDIPVDFWIFIDGSRFLDDDIDPDVLPYERNVTIVNNTTIYNNFSFRGDRFVNDGLGVDRVRRFTGRDAPRYTIRDARQPGQYRVSGSDVQVYRPSFKADANARPKDFMDRNRAQRELAPTRVFEPPRQPIKTLPETYVRQQQTQERKLLQTTQSNEMKALDRQRNDQLKTMPAGSEKAKAQQDYQMKKSALVQQHQVERQQMDQRHKTDVQQVRQSTPTGKNARSRGNKG